MKIIKSGTHCKRIECNCGCVFEYFDSDIQSTFITATTDYVGNYYVVCPECGEHHNIIIPHKPLETIITCDSPY